MAKFRKKLKAIYSEVTGLRENDQALTEEIFSLRDDNTALLGEISLLRGESSALIESISKLMESEKENVPVSAPIVSTTDYTPLQQEIKELSRQFQKHDLAIADMLDTWEEWRNSQVEQENETQTELLQKHQDEIDTLQSRENAMTEALICCLDQLFTLEQAADSAGDESWLRQISLAENTVREKCLTVSLQVIGQKGDAFSYEQHEPLEKIYTDQTERHMTIARVIRRGYWMQGKRIRKAQVSVYVMREETEA